RLPGGPGPCTGRWSWPRTWLQAVLAIEAFHPPGGINQALLPGIKWMALGTDFNVHRGKRGAGLKSVATGASHRATPILRMYSGFHIINLSAKRNLTKYQPLRARTTRVRWLGALVCG